MSLRGVKASPRSSHTSGEKLQQYQSVFCALSIPLPCLSSVLVGAVFQDLEEIMPLLARVSHWLSAPARITVRPPPRFPRKSRKGWKEGISCRRNRIRRVDGSSIIPPSGGINGRPTGTLLGRNIFFHWMESGTLFSCTSAVTLGDAMIPCRRRAACNYLLGRSTRDDAGSPD